MHDEPEEAGVAETPKNIRLITQSDMQPLMDAFADVGKTVGAAFENIKTAFDGFKPDLTQLDYTLQPGITAEQLAKAFDVPLSVVGLDPIPAPDLSFLHDYEHPVGHLVSTGEPGKYTLVNGPADPPKIPEGEPLTFEVSAPWLSLGTTSYLDKYVNDQIKAQLKAEDDAFEAQLKKQDPKTWEGKTSKDVLADIEVYIQAIKKHKPSHSPIEQIGMDLAMNGEAFVAKHEDGTLSSYEMDKSGKLIASGGTISPPPSNHASGLAMDFNASVGKPIPGQMYLEGDGDPFEHKVKPSYLTFDVLGKAQPVVVTPPKLATWKTDLGQIDQQGDVCQVSLHGVVSTDQGLHEIGAQIVMTDLELAKQLIGVIPNDGPGTGTQVLEQAAGGQLFTWEAGTGWVPKLPDQPLHAAFPEVSTATHKLAFTAGPKPSSWETSTVHGKEYEHPAGMPPQHPADGTQHTGPDGAVWEFQLAGGWRVVEDMASPINRAPYGWWCSYCGEHMTVHKGDPVACDSGGWMRPATSAEHKLAMMQA